jgi:FtsP/CotA-like multicopper oxidase with cupredoxin domain
MSEIQDRLNRMNRRNFLKAAAVLGVGAVGGLGSVELIQKLGERHLPTRLTDVITRKIKEQHVGFTDGWVSMPNNAAPIPPFWPDPSAPANRNAFVFGIRSLMTPNGDRSQPWVAMHEAAMFAQKGHGQLSAPILFADQDSDFRLHLHNLGEQLRPTGTPDNHTIHFHGFTNQIVYFDGVPDTSIAAAIGRELIYRYIPEDPGTYMYHCHIDDVEHVHMGLYGVVFIRSNSFPGPQGQRAAFNDPTSLPLAQQSWYDREFAMILSEFDVRGHWSDAHSQDMDWSDYRPSFRLMNGRAYPDTTRPHYDPMLANLLPSPLPAGPERLRFNPNSSLIQANAGERILIRIANLGFEEHSLMLPGIPITVVGRDAKPLYANRPDYGVDGPIAGTRGNIQWTTNRVDLGPGESRDLIITVPAASNGAGPNRPDVYPLYDRNWGYVNTASDQDQQQQGAMRTDVHVYPGTTLPAQTRPAGLYVFDQNGTRRWIETWATGTEPV